MKRAKHIFLVVALFIIAVIAYLSVSEIKGKSKVLKKDVAIETNASSLLNDIIYVKTVKGTKEFKVRAKSAEFFKADGVSNFKNIDAEFYSGKGEKYYLTGLAGTYDTRTEEMSIEGDVVLTSEDGLKLTTDTLNYSHTDNTLFTSDPVKIMRGDMSLDGIGMKLDITKRKLRIERDVKGHITGT